MTVDSLMFGGGDCIPKIVLLFLFVSFLCLNAEDNKQRSDGAPQWVALAVVQSYNPRRKVPRSKISLPDLESCISKASSSAAQHSGNHSYFWFLFYALPLKSCIQNGRMLLSSCTHVFFCFVHFICWSFFRFWNLSTIVSLS